MSESRSAENVRQTQECAITCTTACVVTVDAGNEIDHPSQRFSANNVRALSAPMRSSTDIKRDHSSSHARLLCAMHAAAERVVRLDAMTHDLAVRARASRRTQMDRVRARHRLAVRAQSLRDRRCRRSAASAAGTAKRVSCEIGPGAAREPTFGAFSARDLRIVESLRRVHLKLVQLKAFCRRNRHATSSVTKLTRPSPAIGMPCVVTPRLCTRVSQRQHNARLATRAPDRHLSLFVHRQED